MPYFAHVFEGEENIDAVSIIFYNKSRCKTVTDKTDSCFFLSSVLISGWLRDTLIDHICTDSALRNQPTSQTART